MIFVAGSSGSGKTTIIDSFVKRHPEFTHLRASSVLRSLGRPTHDSSLDDLKENQNLIINFILKHDYNHHYILDGHMVMPVGSHNYMVPIDFVVRLPLSILIFLREDPKTIAMRRGLPTTPDNASEISRLQEIELLHMHEAAIVKGCPLLSIAARQSKELDRWLLHYGTA
ncbi:AAA family ATPase [Rhizobium leguminosarum]|uniref:ATP-binding protein n=1 Tax=Rhizobium leguminosarum TaxID=384 RepID=UPI001030D1D3|nr:ATP-binding protein [Rhizobium leguminosarum]TAV50963.1 AAA family ATPase [Rhizobium leguminosarum]TAV60324.1 AAA family ATPase [Rhizobium leguminosarum]TAV71371.1 AAA family ATPase [Rhizobium leguminosarum]TAY69006.1 AAA family ATPase [Rhizobium leguminosarum]